MSIFGFGAIADSQRKVREEDARVDARIARNQANTMEASRDDWIAAYNDLKAKNARLLEQLVEERDARAMDTFNLSAFIAVGSALSEALAGNPISGDAPDGSEGMVACSAARRKIFVDAFRAKAQKFVKALDPMWTERYLNYAETLLLERKFIAVANGPAI
jgi:hypothetical protein